MQTEMTISDQTYALYKRHAQKLGKTPEDTMALILDRFSLIDPDERFLLLHTEHRAALESVLSGGHLRSAADLVDKVQKLADIQVGKVRVTFTPAQLAELKRRADKNGQTVEEAIKQTVKSIEALFFDHLS